MSYYVAIERNNCMKKEDADNVEIYFVCDRKEKVELIESYYDEESNTHYWYFNAYLAYEAWKNNFKGIDGELAQMLLTVAASRYLIYRIDQKDYNSKKELKQIKKEMKKINPRLDEIIKENQILLNL